MIIKQQTVDKEVVKFFGEQQREGWRGKPRNREREKWKRGDDYEVLLANGY